MLITLFSCLFEMIFIIAVGFFARKKNLLTEESTKGLSDLLIDIFLPCTVLASTSVPFDPAIGNDIKICIVLSFFYYLIGIPLSYLIFKALPLEKNKKGIATTSTLFGNTGFIGYPLIAAMYGELGLKLGLGFDIFFNPFIYTIGIRLFSSEKMGTKELLRLIFSPCLISVIIANALYFSGLRLPILFEDIVTIVGNCTTPISMLVIGSGFVNANFSNIFKDKYIYLVNALKLVVYPLLLFLILSFFKASELVKLVCVTMAALPVGSLNVILPKKYGGDVEFANKTLLVSMILSLITIPMVIMIIS